MHDWCASRPGLRAQWCAQSNSTQQVGSSGLNMGHRSSSGLNMGHRIKTLYFSLPHCLRCSMFQPFVLRDPCHQAQAKGSQRRDGCASTGCNASQGRARRFTQPRDSRRRRPRLAKGPPDGAHGENGAGHAAHLLQLRRTVRGETKRKISAKKKKKKLGQRSRKRPYMRLG